MISNAPKKTEIARPLVPNPMVRVVRLPLERVFP